MSSGAIEAWLNGDRTDEENSLEPHELLEVALRRAGLEVYPSETVCQYDPLLSAFNCKKVTARDILESVDANLSHIEQERSAKEKMDLIAWEYQRLACVLEKLAEMREAQGRSSATMVEGQRTALAELKTARAQLEANVKQLSQDLRLLKASPWKRAPEGEARDEQHGAFRADSERTWNGQRRF